MSDSQTAPNATPSPAPAPKPLVDILAAAGLADDSTPNQAPAQAANETTPPAAPAAGSAPTDTPAPPAGQPAQDAGTNPAVDPRIAMLQELGFADVSDPEDGFKRLADAYKQIRNETEQERRAREEAERRAEIERAIAERNLQGQTRQPEQPAAPKLPFGLGAWQKPDADKLSQYVVEKTGEDGKVVRELAENTPAELRQQVETYNRQRAEFAAAWRDDPFKVLTELVPALVQPVLQESFKQQQAAAEMESFSASIVTNHPYLFERNPVTNQVDPNKLSTHGEEFAKALDEAADLGITDQRKQFQYALRVVPPPAAPKPPAATAADYESQRRDAQAKHLQQAAKAVAPTPNGRGGSFHTPAGDDVQNPNQGLGSLIAEALGQVPRP